MATKGLKRKVDNPEDCNTPSVKIPKPVTRSEPPRTRSNKKTTLSKTVSADQATKRSLEDEIHIITDESDNDSEDMATKPPTAEEFRAILQEGLSTVAKKEDLDKLMGQVDRNATAINSINARINDLEGQFRQANGGQEQRFRDLEIKLDQPASDHQSREAAYDKARRSLRVWPIKGEDEKEMRGNLTEFAINALLIDEDTMDSIAIKEIIRVRSSPNGNVHQEVRVTFASVSDRDFVNSRATNLEEYRDGSGRPEAGVRMDVPPFLLTTFKQLNDHGYDIRRAHGPKTKRYVKFDEERLSLILEVRLPRAVKWLRISPEQARTFYEEKDQLDYGALRKDLLRHQRQLSPSSAPNSNLIPLGLAPTRRGLSTTSSIGSSASIASSTNGVPVPSTSRAMHTGTPDGSQKKRWIPPARKGNDHPAQ